MEYVLPENTKNRLLKAVNLLKKGYTKWDQMPRKTRNAVAGLSFVASGIILPKLLFVGSIAAIFAGKHVYLNGEVEEAVTEVVELNTATAE